MTKANLNVSNTIIPKEHIDNLVNSEAGLNPGFSSMGVIRGRQDYSDAEKTVLEYFFTNTDSNIYAATDNMPSQLWALLMGQYARSSLTARDRLLKLFEDMKKTAEKLKEKGRDSKPEYFTPEFIANLVSGEDKTIQSVNFAETSLVPHLKKLSFETDKEVDEFSDGVVALLNSLDMGYKRKSLIGQLNKRAGEFIEMYGVDYGHASLRDSDVIRMCFEGVSQRATKFLEAAREGAYQEQSTRALPFKKENLGMPLEIKGTKYEPVLSELGDKLLSFYEIINSELLAHLDPKFSTLRSEADEKIREALKDDAARLPDNAWSSIIKGKTFDVARYLLPQNMTTSLGVTLNTRRFQDQLTQWQSLPYWEMQLIGKAAQIEAMKLSPNLMKYGNASEFYQNLPKNINLLFGELIGSKLDGEEFEYKHYDESSKLITSTPDLENWVLASILFSSTENKYTMKSLKNHVSGLSVEDKRKIAETLLAGKSSHDIYPKLAEIGAMTFERIYDVGAYRDLQRQRGDRQQISSYNVIGFNVPKEITEIGRASEFTNMMHEVKQVHEFLKAEVNPWVAEYATVMANVVRHVVTKDATQQFYEGGLRTVPQGIDSYRKIVQQEMKQTLELMPSFKGLVAWDDKYYDLGRLDETVNGYIRNQLALSKK